jgi:hypothetical protein
MTGAVGTALVTARLGAFPCEAEAIVEAASSERSDGRDDAAAVGAGIVGNTRRSSTGAGGLWRPRSMLLRLASSACQLPEARAACGCAALGVGDAPRRGSLAITAPPSGVAGRADATLCLSVAEPAGAGSTTEFAAGSEPRRCTSATGSLAVAGGGAAGGESAGEWESGLVTAAVFAATFGRSCGTEERAIEFEDVATGAMLAPRGRLDFATCDGEAGG